MRQLLGNHAESLACAHLLKQGLRLIRRNYRCKAGEIDLVMCQDDVLVFVEVRYRKTTHYGTAAESVTWHKQRKLMRAAEHFLLLNKKYSGLKCRFDVVSMKPIANVTTAAAVDMDVLWLQDAFQA